MFEETAISVSKTVDKTENANNNEIKILVLTPDYLKSRKKLCFQTILCINTLENAKLWRVFVIFSGAKKS